MRGFFILQQYQIHLLIAMERLKISDFLGLSKGNVVIDVRSPSEYAHAHIPGAVNLPLFSDEERKQVGTTYKQVSRETAIKIGLEYFGPKMKPLVESVEQLVDENNKTSVEPGTSPSKKVFVYCWRGGMRSGAVSWLLNLYGFKVYTLIGGYKTFRKYVLEIFEQPYQFKILGGFTGSGKTLVLNQLKNNGETVIDLENLAAHKGSAFGNIELLQQPTQEMFENNLALELLKKSAPVNARKNGSPAIWLEDESQRIGNLNLPNALWNSIRNSPVYFLEIDFEKRLDHICKEYGSFDPARLAEATLRIHKRLGPNETKKTLGFLEQGNIREAFSILLNYYDKHYLKGFHNRTDLGKLLTILPCNEVTPANSRLLETLYLPI